MSRRIWVIGVVLVVQLAAALALVPGAGDSTPPVRLSAADDAPAPERAPSIEDVGPSSTTTPPDTSVVTTTTPLAPSTVTSKAPPKVRTAPTTVVSAVPAPSQTTIAPTPSRKAGTATITVVNEYYREVGMSVTDVNQNNWRVWPGETKPPWELITSSEHGDSVGAAVFDEVTCGRGGNGDYFEAGHAYKVVVGTDPQPVCKGRHGLTLVVYDLTSGTSRTVYNDTP